MTETTNLKLKKPGLNDPVDISVLNENFDRIDDSIGGVSTYVIDLTSVLTVDFWNSGSNRIDLTDTVDGAAILAATDKGSLLRLRLLTESGSTVEMALDDRLDTSTYTQFGGIADNPQYESYAQFQLRIRTDSGAVELVYHPHVMASVVTSINGIPPDENGNVDIETSSEQPVSIDLSNYEAGSIRLTYADGGAMDVAVTFDENGNPIKFSNGTEEFTITWPAEEVTGE